MKQSIKKWMCCAFALCATICLVACDKNDDPTPAPEKVIAKHITYELYGIYDLKDLIDISIEYTDATGKKVTEAVTDVTWKKTIEKVNIPFTAYMKVTYKIKPNVSYTKDSYNVGSGYGISYELSDNTIKSGGTEHVLQISKAKIEAYLTKLAATPLESTEIVDVRK